MEQPYFSVVIPLYNKSQSITSTVQSVLEQTYSRFELLIVDDGSTDGSDEIVRQLCDDRIRYIRQPNGGASRARNTGIREAQNEFVAFLDADDRWEPNHLESLALLIVQFPDAGLFGTAYRITDEGANLKLFLTIKNSISATPGIMDDYFQICTFGSPPFFTSSACVPREILISLGGFKEGVRHAEDLDMWARVALRYDVAFYPVPTVIYRTEAENRMMKNAPKLEYWGFRKDYDVAVESGLVPAQKIDAISEFISRIDLYHARLNILNSDRDMLRVFIRGINTRLLIRHKRVYLLLSYIPSKQLSAMIAAYQWVNSFVKRILVQVHSKSS